jgi:flagellar hook-associated protein 3 FlgL
MSSNISAAGQQFLAGIATIQNTINKANQEVSSGLKVSVASDAPDSVSEILQLHAEIQSNTQVTQNLSNVQGAVDASDSAISSATTILDQVQTLASQGQGLTQTAADRASLGSQVQDLLGQLVSISNTTFEGRYVFSGDADQSPSYALDGTTQTVTRLQVSPSTQQVADSTGTTFPVALSANQIFDARDANDQPATGNVFAAVSAVSTALIANDTAGLQTASGALSTASTYLDQQQTFYGYAEDRITAAQSQASTASVTLQSNLAGLTNANEATAVVQMQQGTTNLQAAMAAYAKIPQTTLFDDMPNT